MHVFRIFLSRSGVQNLSSRRAGIIRVYERTKDKNKHAESQKFAANRFRAKTRCVLVSPFLKRLPLLCTVRVHIRTCVVYTNQVKTSQEHDITYTYWLRNAFFVPPVRMSGVQQAEEARPPPPRPTTTFRPYFSNNHKYMIE